MDNNDFNFQVSRLLFPDWRACCLHRRAAGTVLFFCFLVLPFAVQAEQVDRIVAAVNYEVISASDLAHAVALNARLDRSTDRALLESETFEGLITRRLLVQEARRLRFVEVSDQEIVAESDRLRKQFGSDAAFADFLAEQEVSPQELSRMLRERLLVERFVEKKVGLFVRVSRDEAQKYFDEHAGEFQGRRFQDVQKNILALLLERTVGRHLEQYVAELRGKADIRLNRAEERTQ